MKDSAINFFLQNKDSLAEYIGKIKVNGEKTLLKYGYIEDKNISITFYTYGQLDETITNYEEKIKHLFDTNEDLNDLNQFIEEINLPYTIHFSPYLKISRDDEVLTYAFHITVKFEK